MVLRNNRVVIGYCGFKAPQQPTVSWRLPMASTPIIGAKEAAQALVSYALNTRTVRLARAHILPEKNASTRALTKCGFRHVGSVMDPDDGLVLRWETPRVKQTLRRFG
jgi:ribosomal-protein-alanine N-acetyltransferase